MTDWRAEVRRAMPGARDEQIEEMAQHCEDVYRDAIDSGLDAHAARRLALPIAVPPARPARIPVPWRTAARSLRRTPALTVISVAVLGLAIAVNGLVFSVTNAVLWKPMPYPDPDRLVSVEIAQRSQPSVPPMFSGDDYRDIAGQAKSYSELAAISPVWNVAMRGAGLDSTERVEALFVSANFFPMLGVQPAIGRLFQREERNVALVSHEFWRTRLGGEPGVVGQAVEVDGSPGTIVGVMPPGFRWRGRIGEATNVSADVWFPLAANPFHSGRREVRLFHLVGRLTVPAEKAAAELATIWSGLEAKHSATNSGYVTRLRPLREQAIGSARGPVLAVLILAGLVMLAACANVANLLLVRSERRASEYAIRSALGATRTHLAAQAMAEGTLIAVVATAVGWAAARATSGLALALVPATIPGRQDVELDSAVFAYSAVLGVVTSLVCALLPVLRYSAVNARMASRTFASGRLGTVLVVAEAAIATVLLLASGLLLRSFQKLSAVDVGMRTENVLTISTQVPTARRTPAERLAFFERAQAALASVPGVRAVAAVSRLPLLGGNIGSEFHVEGRLASPAEHPEIGYRIASRDYFQTLGVPLVAGRLYSGRDPLEVVINQAAVRQYFGGESPLGRRVRFGLARGNDAEPWSTIVGVTGDLRHSGLDIAPQPEAFRPYVRNPLQSPVFVVSTDGTVGVGTIRTTLRETAEGAPVFNSYRLTELVDRSLAARRLPMLLLSGFAALTLLLAALGLYSVMSQIVVRRAREFGIRLSLGATPGGILGLILRHGLRWAAVGVTLGCMLGGAGAVSLKAFLFETNPLDTVAISATAASVVIVCAVALAVPGLRAARVEPASILRAE